MSINIKAKDTRRILKLRNIPIVLKERPNGYQRPKLIKVQTQVDSKKEQRSRWLAGDPKEFIERIRKTKADISQGERLKESLINIHFLQSEPNIFQSAKPFKNNRYEINLTESDQFNSLNPDRDDRNQIGDRDSTLNREEEEKLKEDQMAEGEGEKEEQEVEKQKNEEEETSKKKDDIFGSTIYAQTEPNDNPSTEKKLSDYLVNPFIPSSIQTPPPNKTQTSQREHNPSYYSDNFNQIQETFGEEYFYDEYESSYPLYSNNKFDRAAHPLAMSMNLNTTVTAFDKQKAEGRKSHNGRNYNSERSSHRLKKIIKHYFLVKDNEEEENQAQKFTYTLSYMKDLKNWKMSKQSLLIPSNVQEQLDSYALVEKVYLDKDGQPIEEDVDADEDNNKDTEPNDYLIKIAERNKEQIKQNLMQNSTKGDIRELLNAITIDNYTSIKDDLVAIIKQSPDNQIKFVEVLFIKAIKEQLYSGIYAKLCKDIDRWLTTKKDKAKSPMREHLIEICKKSFKDKLTSIDDQIILSRKLLIGCVNFFAELINVQMISKKVALQRMKNLLDQYTSTKEPYVIEAAIVLLDKFATIITKQREKIRKEDNDLFKEHIDLRCNELDDLSKSDLPSHIIYKIINLLHKKMSGWKPSLYEQSQILMPSSEEYYSNSNRDTNYYNAHSAREYSRNTSHHSAGLYNSPNTFNTHSMSNRNTNTNTNTQSSLRKSELIQGPDIEFEEDHNPIQDTTTDKAYQIIFKDIKDCIIFIQNGNSISQYKWKDIESIYSTGLAYMDQIVLLYIDAALEHLPSLKTSKAKNALHDYFRVLIEYYYAKLSQKEVDGIVDEVTAKIKGLCSMKKNNKNFSTLKEIMGNVLYYLIKYEIIQMKNFNVFCREKYNIIETFIDLIIEVIVYSSETKTKMMNNFKETKLYKENVDLVNTFLNYE